EQARVVGEAAQQPGGAALWIAREREARRQRAGALLQALDAEEFAVQGAGVEADQPRTRPARRERCAGWWDARSSQEPGPFRNGPRGARGPNRDDQAIVAGARGEFRGFERPTAGP